MRLIFCVFALLLSFGIKSKLYDGRRCGVIETLLPDGRGGGGMAIGSGGGFRHLPRRS